MGAAGASWKPDICIKNDADKTFPFWFQCACLFIHYYPSSVKNGPAKVKHTISQIRINITAVPLDAPLKMQIVLYLGLLQMLRTIWFFLRIISVPAKEKKKKKDKTCTLFWTAHHYGMLSSWRKLLLKKEQATNLLLVEAKRKTGKNLRIFSYFNPLFSFPKERQNWIFNLPDLIRLWDTDSG